MTAPCLRAAVLVLGLAAALPAGAQLYKWTDANGRVQYSDRPPVNQPATRLGASAPAPAPAAPAASAAEAKEDGKSGETAKTNAPMSVAEQEQAFRKRRMEAEEARQKQAKLDEEKRAKDQACQRTRNYLKSVEGGRRIARTNEQGETEFLNDDQLQQEAERARKDLATHCSG